MPLKDLSARREYHKNYLRERYRKDPTYRLKHQQTARVSDVKRKTETKVVLAAFKQQGCALCDEREPCCLAAHHLDPAAKDFDVGDRGKISARRLVAELHKCVCLCANCHMKVHAGILTLPATSAAARATGRP